MQNVLKVIYIAHIIKLSEICINSRFCQFADISKVIFILYVGDKNKLQKMVQMAWTFVNDRYVTLY